MKKQLGVNEGVLRGIPNFIRRAFFAVCICIFAIGCSKEEFLPPEDVAPTDRDGMIALQLEILTPTEVVTRGGEEDAIKRGFLYVFDVGGNYVAHEEIVSANIDNTTGTTKIYFSILKDLQLPLANTNTVVLILNHEEGNIPADPKLVTTETINEAFPLGSSTGKGLVTAGTLPMYGELKGWPPTTSIPICRAVAKVSIVVSNVSGNYSTGFATARYGIFNNTSTGHIKSATQEEGDYVFNVFTAANKQITPLANSDVATLTTTPTYLYEYPYATRIIGDETVLPSLSESANSGRLAIILKVPSVGDIAERYYRLDLAKRSAQIGFADYLDIKRNHHYRIVINSVDDAGYASAEEAINGNPSNIEFSTIVNQGGGTTVSNGKYAINIKEGIVPTEGVKVLVNNVLARDFPIQGRVINSSTHTGKLTTTWSSVLKGGAEGKFTVTNPLSTLGFDMEVHNFTVKANSAAALDGTEQVEFTVKYGDLSYVVTYDLGFQDGVIDQFITLIDEYEYAYSYTMGELEASIPFNSDIS